MTDQRPYQTTTNEANAEVAPITPLEVSALEEANAEQAAGLAASSKPPVKVLDASSATEGEIVRGLLTSEGIPAVFEALPGYSLTDEVILGETFHGAVLVAPEDEERALQLIAAYLEAPALTDDEEAAESSS